MKNIQKETWILIVDDDINHRSMLRANLQSLGYGVIEAPTGEAAIPATEKDTLSPISQVYSPEAFVVPLLPEVQL